MIINQLYQGKYMLKIKSAMIFIPMLLSLPMTLPAETNKAMVPIIAYLLSDTEQEPEPGFIVPAIDEAEKQEFLTAINNARSQPQDCGTYGIKPAVSSLVWNEKLYKAAYTYNYDMAYGGAWSHVGSGTEFDIVASNIVDIQYSTMTDRITYYDYRYFAIGENIAAGYNSTASVISGWLGSDGHCANMMNSNYTEVGMSLLINPDDSKNYYYYWTQNFGRS